MTRHAPRAHAAVALFVAASLAALAGCGGDDGDGDGAALPVIDQVTPAIAAVDAALGAPQEYFEVNATERLVNLFVAGDAATTATAYVYLDGELHPPAPPEQAAGNTFTGEAVDFDPDRVLDRIAAELDDPVVSQFVVVASADGTVQYSAVVVSDQGGVLTVVLAGDGEVLSVDPG